MDGPFYRPDSAAEACEEFIKMYHPMGCEVLYDTDGNEITAFKVEKLEPPFTTHQYLLCVVLPFFTMYLLIEWIYPYCCVQPLGKKRKRIG